MIAASGYAQTTLPQDSTAVLDSLIMDSLVGPPAAAPIDAAPKRTFIPPSNWGSPSGRKTAVLLAGPSWPMPAPHDVAGGDLADWLSYHPAYDVDDATGLGQTRFFTHWGLVSRAGDWTVNGRKISWQRLTFPMTARFDAAILPSFGFETYHFGERAFFAHDSSWGDRPAFNYTFRQGDYSDTYSEGDFHGRTKGGFGLDLSGTFFDSDGRYANDSRDQRIIGLQTLGPLTRGLLWRVGYSQFRDKSQVLTPVPFDQVFPERDDLLWSLEGALAGNDDSVTTWVSGVRAQSGKQSLLDTFTDSDSLGHVVLDTAYSVESRDVNWELFLESDLAGWTVDARAGLEELEIDTVDDSRWFARLSGSRFWNLQSGWVAALSGTASDYDTDPLEFEITASLTPDPRRPFLPQIRGSRTRVAPTMFDRLRPSVEYVYFTSSQQAVLYSEMGDPSLEDQWNNTLSIQWDTDNPTDTTGFGWTVAGHAEYIQDYTVWEGRVQTDSIAGVPVTQHRYRPFSQDARSLGAAVGIHGPLFWKIHYLTHYAVKYATDLNDRKLYGYSPHKGLGVLSLIAPRWLYGVDFRFDVAGLWWYGDSRIEPTGYESSHVFRLDISGSARAVPGLWIQAQMQNVAGFAYRTGAGYPFTGRTLRFGIRATLFD